jgi:hypothetical protein
MGEDDGFEGPVATRADEIDLTDGPGPGSVEERLERVERLLEADLSSVFASTAQVGDRLDLLDRRLDRLTRLVEAATAPLEDDETADPALARIEEAIVGLTVVVQQLGVAATEAAGRRP